MFLKEDREETIDRMVKSTTLFFRLCFFFTKGRFPVKSFTAFHCSRTRCIIKNLACFNVSLTFEHSELGYVGFWDVPVCNSISSCPAFCYRVKAICISLIISAGLFLCVFSISRALHAFDTCDIGDMPPFWVLCIWSTNMLIYACGVCSTHTIAVGEGGSAWHTPEAKGFMMGAYSYCSRSTLKPQRRHRVRVLGRGGFKAFCFKERHSVSQKLQGLSVEASQSLFSAWVDYQKAEQKKSDVIPADLCSKTRCDEMVSTGSFRSS